jgi:hypothetical protein
MGWSREFVDRSRMYDCDGKGYCAIKYQGRNRQEVISEVQQL